MTLQTQKTTTATLQAVQAVSQQRRITFLRQLMIVIYTVMWVSLSKILLTVTGIFECESEHRFKSARSGGGETSSAMWPSFEAMFRLQPKYSLMPLNV